MRPVILAVVSALLASSGAAATTPITPGYWESTNKLVSPFRSTSVEKRCITPADVEAFMAGPSNRHYACTYPTRLIRNGKIVLKGTCVSRRGRKLAVKGDGSYTPTSFQLKATVAIDFGGFPVQGVATTEARRIADDCPASEQEP